MILILMGKSAAGKDRLQSELEKNKFTRIVSATTRPKRAKEIEGKDYFFVTDERFTEMEKSGKFVESRTYNTFQDGKPAVWHYAAPAVDYNASDWVIVLDAKGADDYIRRYGRDNCFTVLVEVSDEIRKKRAEKRGSFDLQEWNRRLVDDNKVFASVNTDLKVNNEGEISETINTILNAVAERRLR